MPGNPFAAERRASLPLEPPHAPTHGFQGQAPLAAKVVAFNRTRTGRIKYTVSVRFEGQEWRVQRFYTDFLRLRNKLEVSQYNAAASDLPPKHPLRLKLRMKLSLSKRRGMRKEMTFIAHRMVRLERWLNKLLQHTGPLGLYNVAFLDDFFEALPCEEEYNRARSRPAHVAIDRSLFHALKSMGVPDDVYPRLWDAGYSFESLEALDQRTWLAHGVSRVLSEQLVTKFSARRRRQTEVATAAIARAASIAFPIDLARAHPMLTPPMSRRAPSDHAAVVPPPYTPKLYDDDDDKKTPTTPTKAAAASAPPEPSAAPAPSAPISAPATPPFGHGLTPIMGSPPDADASSDLRERQRQQRVLAACALLGRRNTLQ